MFKAHILQAFKSILGAPLTIEIRCESKNVPLILPASKNAPCQMAVELEAVIRSRMPRAGESLDVGTSEIVEILESPMETKANEHVDKNSKSRKRGVQRASLGEPSVSHKKPSNVALSEGRKVSELSQSKSLVRSKVSLAHVIQQAEGCAQQSAWSKRKVVSIAEKLEQENLYVYSIIDKVSMPLLYGTNILIWQLPDSIKQST